MKAPVDLRLAPAAVGAWLACHVGITRSASVMAFVVVVGAIGIVLACWPRRGARHRSLWRGWVSLTLLFGVIVAVVVSATTAAHVEKRNAALETVTAVSTDIEVELRLTSEVKAGAAGLGAHGLLTSVRGPQQSLRGKLPVYVLGAREHWRVGMTLTVGGAVSAGSDHRAFLRVRSVRAETLPTGVHHLVDRLREGVRNASASLPPHARGLLPGVSIGDDRRLPDHVGVAMRDTSLTHITAVSGAHVAIVLGTVLFILGPVPRLVKTFVVLCVLATMVIVVLPTPSVLRAGGMGALTLLALGTKRPRLALPVLFFTVVVLLVWDPWLATSIGFALSVSATLGIVLMTEPLARLGGGGIVARAFAVPTAAQLWCAPLLLTFDASLATYSVPANLLALPALAPATVTALASAVLSLVSPTAAAQAASFGQYFTAWIVTVAQFFADLPGARLPWLPGRAGVGLLIAVSLGLVWGLRLLHRRGTWQA